MNLKSRWLWSILLFLLCIYRILFIFLNFTLTESSIDVFYFLSDFFPITFSFKFSFFEIAFSNRNLFLCHPKLNVDFFFSSDDRHLPLSFLAFHTQYTYTYTKKMIKSIRLSFIFIFAFVYFFFLFHQKSFRFRVFNSILKFITKCHNFYICSIQTIFFPFSVFK